MNSDTERLTVIEPSKGWNLINIRELLDYRDLFRFLVWRDIKVLYAQTIMGFAWAILNPLIQILIFSIVFGHIAEITVGGVPYLLFNTMAVIPWTYMQEAMMTSSQSLVKGQAMLGKIYFPRLIFPLTPILAKLVDFGISIVLLAAIWAYYYFYHQHSDGNDTDYELKVTWNLLLLPLFLFLMVCVPTAFGLWMSSLAIRFRDVKFAMPFISRMLMFTGPIVYAASSMSDSRRLVYSLNPIVPVIEGFRACLLGEQIDWQFIVPGAIICILATVGGLFYFRRMERVFADVI